MSEYIELKDDGKLLSPIRNGAHPKHRKSWSENQRKSWLPLDLKAKSSNSVEMLIKKEAEKEQQRIKGKYFGDCLILMKLSDLDEVDTLNKIKEHAIHKMLYLRQRENKHKKGKMNPLLEFWTKIENLEVETIILTSELTNKMSPQEIANLTEPFAQCLMNVIQYNLQNNCSSKNEYNLMFTYAEFQHKAQQEIIDVIKGGIFIKNDDENFDDVERERLHLECYRRNPNNEQGKLLVVYENLANAAFIAIGYRMVVYGSSLKQSYNLFRAQMDEIPVFNKLQVYVLQSLDYARLGCVTLSMNHFRFNNLNAAMINEGLIDSN